MVQTLVRAPGADADSPASPHAAAGRKEIVTVQGLSKRYRRSDPPAVDDVSLNITRGSVFGLIGPDGAGKTTIIQVLAGVVRPDAGSVRVAGVDVVKDPEGIKPLIGYMPQGLGQNLYETLSIQENILFFKNLRQVPEERFLANSERLLRMTRLDAFLSRPAGKLSGGMRQKLALVCTLLHLPGIILLDEPTTGVDPISRRDFWTIIQEMVSTTGMTVLLTTSYMDEAERCQEVALMNGGRIIASGSPDQLTAGLQGELFELYGPDLSRKLGVVKRWPGCESAAMFGETIHAMLRPGAQVDELRQQLDGAVVKAERIEPGLEDVFVHMLAAGDETDLTSLAGRLVVRQDHDDDPVVIDHLTCRFGDFTAVSDVTFQVKNGEILGLLGPNGAGKTTLIKMLCGLQEPSSGRAVVVGYDIRTQRWALRSSIGYMSQKFSLYGDLTVWQNLSFYAGLYGLTGEMARKRLQALVDLLGLGPYRLAQSASLPMGLRQRMALACALVHEPRLLFLDEPTSGVDPIARREFWNLVHGLASGAQVTVFVTTHYMDEASHCHRLGLMQQGHLIALDEPERLINRAQEEAGPLLTVNADDFSRAFQVLHEAFPAATLYGRRIQWQTKTLQQDQQKAEALLKQAGVHGRLAEVRLSMEEAFVYFVSTSGL